MPAILEAGESPPLSTPQTYIHIIVLGKQDSSGGRTLEHNKNVVVVMLPRWLTTAGGDGGAAAVVDTVHVLLHGEAVAGAA